MEAIKKNPYRFIRDFYEDEFPCVGKKIFSVLSLVPVSLIIPKIPAKVKETKQKINLLWISPPGSGKSSIAEEFEKITINPLSTSKITPARLYLEIKKRKGKKISIIAPDVSIMFSDEELIKINEGITGEEESIGRSTMRNINEETREKVDGVAYYAGTPRTLSDNKIRDGVLGRTFPILTYFTEEENKKIIDKINNRIGKDVEIAKKTKIHQYYEELYSIQNGTHKKFKPIQGYIFSDEIIKNTGEFIKNLNFLKIILNKWGITSARATEEIYRFMTSLAFLNIYNRKIIDNKLVISEEDYNIAKRLMSFESQETYKIFKAIERIDYYNIRNEREFRLWDLKMKNLRKKNPLEKDIRETMKGIVKK